MSDELAALLERVADDGARRARPSAQVARDRGARLRRRRVAATGLGAGVLVTAVIGGLAVAATPAPAPAAAVAPGSPVCHRPAADRDVDGDCRADRITVSGNSVVVQGSRAGRLSAAVRHTGTLRVAGSRDVDADGRAEVWVATGGGAYALVRYDGTALRAVTAAGTQLQVRVGGSPTRTDVGCRNGQLIVATGTSRDGVRYQGGGVVYTLHGFTAVGRSLSGSGWVAVWLPRLMDCGIG